MPTAPSIRRELIVSVAVPLVLFCALTIVVLDGIFRGLSERALRELLEEQLIAVVSSAETASDGRIGLRLLDPESRLLTPGSGYYAVVRARSGALLWSSPSLQGTGLRLDVILAAGGTDYRRVHLAGSGDVAVLSRGLEWEYARGSNVDLVFSVAASTAQQQAQLWRFRQQLTGWFVLLALALLLVLAWRLRRAMAPMQRLEHEIREMEGGQRSGLGGDYPRELAGVTRNLNVLLEGERARIARYRDTLGNLAHGLKTPLAVMRTAAASVGGRERAVLDGQIDRMTQIVEHQLKRAATGGSASLGQAGIDPAPLLGELRAALLRVHAARDLQIQLEILPGSGFAGERGDLLELLGNLLDNGCKWCRGRVRVRLRLEPGAAPTRRLLIQVDDDGPGIPAADRARVRLRGVRVDEHQPGHGLGLAMVSDTVAAYGGELRIDVSEDLGGARVEVQLPGRSLPPAA
ncbi:MAG: histidine kinase [Gammaproteobacteria bacterium]|nr:histidine kinase [Gammaproteobacteria bacterium]